MIGDGLVQKVPDAAPVQDGALDGVPLVEIPVGIPRLERHLVGQRTWLRLPESPRRVVGLVDRDRVGRTRHLAIGAAEARVLVLQLWVLTLLHRPAPERTVLHTQPALG